MPESGPVHWAEGLFLQPHHLQVMQRNTHELLYRERRFHLSYPYGVIDARLSADALENMMVIFDRLRVVMPSGLEVNVPVNADLPALDIKRAFLASPGGIVIYLAVPLYYSGRANTVMSDTTDNWRVKRLYRLAEVEQADENTGENPQPLVLRRYNARLVMDTDDHSDLELVPVLRITKAVGEEVGLPRRDPSFTPPTMMLSGSPQLAEACRDLSNQVEASRNELIVQIRRGGIDMENLRGLQIEHLLRLQILSRFGARLPSLVAVPSISPFEMYVELRQLLAELAALYPNKDLPEVRAYDHENPGPIFSDLISKIRVLLRGAVAPSFIKVDFRPEDNYLIADLTEEHFSRASEYFLGIRTREDPNALARLLEDQDKFKLMVKSLITRAIWGIKLQRETYPPLELPSQSGLYYFRLMRDESGRMWQRVIEENALTCRWPSMEGSDFQLSLYMTVPDMKGGS